MPVSKKPRKPYSGGKTSKNAANVQGMDVSAGLGGGLTFLIDHVIGRAKSTFKGPGRLRADARLAEKRKANESIPSGFRLTRQQVRAAERTAEKARRSAAKTEAAKNRKEQERRRAAAAAAARNGLAYPGGKTVLP